MIVIHGIPNCDSVRKARAWLREHGVEHRFHDYKKLGLDPQFLDRWIASAGWETLLNRRGTTWRRLAAEVRDSIDESSAARLMLENPAIIKRPVLDTGTEIIVGFSAEHYSRRFT